MVLLYQVKISFSFWNKKNWQRVLSPSIETSMNRSIGFCHFGPVLIVLDFLVLFNQSYSRLNMFKLIAFYFFFTIFCFFSNRFNCFKYHESRRFDKANRQPKANTNDPTEWQTFSEEIWKGSFFSKDLKKHENIFEK